MKLIDGDVRDALVGFLEHMVRQIIDRDIRESSHLRSLEWIVRTFERNIWTRDALVGFLEHMVRQIIDR